MSLGFNFIVVYLLILIFKEVTRPKTFLNDNNDSERFGRTNKEAKIESSFTYKLMTGAIISILLTIFEKTWR